MMLEQRTGERRKFNSARFRAGDLQAASQILLLLCIAIGIGCRFVGVNWDSGFHLHPDERFLTMMANRIEWPQSWQEYFHTDSASLNPYNHDTDFFVYGQIPLVAAKAVAALAQRDNYDELVLNGRVLSALFDVLSIGLLFLIAHKITRHRTASLLAAALLALTALHIQHSHFYVVDTFAVTFLLASFLFCQMAIDAETRKARLTWTSASGVYLGAAVACKFSALLFCIALIALVVVSKRSRSWRFLLVQSVFAFAAFRVFHPIAFRGEGKVLSLWGVLDVRPHPQFWDAMTYQQKISSGEIEVPFNLQWIDRTDYLWPLQNLGAWAVGWPTLVCCAVAILVLIIKLCRREIVPCALCIAALWVIVAFLFFGGQFSKFTRYYLVITPFIALLAAWLLMQIKVRTLNVLLGGATLAYAVLWSLAVTSIYTREHTRVSATQWIKQNIPAGNTIANETAWDDGLPLGATQNYRALDLKLFEIDDDAKRLHLLQTLDDTQWIFISSARVWKTIPRVPAKYPFTQKYYQALFDGTLGFEKVLEWRSMPAIGPLVLNDENVEEALTVYDHPHVMLFGKTDKYSAANAARILLKK